MYLGAVEVTAFDQARRTAANPLVLTGRYPAAAGPSLSNPISAAHYTQTPRWKAHSICFQFMAQALVAAEA
jgi:hypothetical protein